MSICPRLFARAVCRAALSCLGCASQPAGLPGPRLEPSACAGRHRAGLAGAAAPFLPTRTYLSAFWALPLLLACGPALSSSSDGVAPYVEYRKHIEASQNISPLDEGLFGDSVSLSNGSTTFAVTDIDLPGNNSLPVRLSRRLAIELQPQGAIQYDASFHGVGNWDIDVPHMTAVFDVSNGWPTQRCTGTTSPAYFVGSFHRHEIWQGVSIHIPGESDRSLLQVQTSTPRPSTGGPYYWTTSNRDALDCIPMVSGLAGEGFRLTTTSGTRYYFNVAVTRTASTLSKWIPDKTTGGLPKEHLLARNRVYLLASKIEDRFGNGVQIEYNATGYPTDIVSSDGRQISMTYANGRVSSATAQGRTWQYHYAEAGTDHLTAVVLPDGSTWKYAYSGTLKPYMGGSDTLPAMPYCQGWPPMLDVSYGVTATHPAGATGTFTFHNSRHSRSGVNANECTPDYVGYDPTYSLLIPHYFDVMSLFSKKIAGPGLGNGMVWSYEYNRSLESLWGTYGEPFSYPCTDCTMEKSTMVTRPDGSKVRHRFGMLYMVNDGRELGTDVLNSDGTVMRSEASDYLSEAAAPTQAFHGFFGKIIDMADPSTARVRPVVKRTTLQEGRTFNWEVASGCNGTYCFDTFARPTKVTKWSSP